MGAMQVTMIDENKYAETMTDVVLPALEQCCEEGWFDPSAADRLAADYLARFGSPLYPLGRITARPGLVWLRDGRPEPLDWHGFEHF